MGTLFCKAAEQIELALFTKRTENIAYGTHIRRGIVDAEICVNSRTDEDIYRFRTGKTLKIAL